MNRSKKLRDDAPDALTGNVREPARPLQKDQVNIVVFLGLVFAAFIALLYGLYGLYTGQLLTMDKITLLYDRVPAARPGNILVALLFLCLSTVLLVYSIYGLRRGGVRNILPNRSAIHDPTYYQGLPMWIMVLSFLSLSVYLIETAVSLVVRNPGYTPRNAWKLMDAENVPLYLSLVFLFVAGWLDDIINERKNQ